MASLDIAVYGSYQIFVPLKQKILELQTAILKKIQLKVPLIFIEKYLLFALKK